MNSQRPVRLLLWSGLAVMACFVMASSSPQCARTSDDPSSGLQTLNSPDPVKVCQRDCAAAARAASRDARKLYRKTVNACKKDPDCIAEAELIYQLTLLEIDEDEIACSLACEHNQGAGSGGQ